MNENEYWAIIGYRKERITKKNVVWINQAKLSHFISANLFQSIDWNQTEDIQFISSISGLLNEFTA